MAKQAPARNLTTDATTTVTPENTPVPGGGRWRWDIALPGWVAVDTDGTRVPTTVPATAETAVTTTQPE